MKKNKIQVFNGFGSFVEPKKIKVEMGDGETQELEADYVLIATGSAVSTLPGLEFDGEKVISSDDIVTNNENYPKSVIILDRKSTRLNSSHANISYAVFCLKKKISCRPRAQTQ